MPIVFPRVHFNCYGALHCDLWEQEDEQLWKLGRLWEPVGEQL